MPLVRIYQGRVMRTEWCDAASDPIEPTRDLTDFSHPLWQHHALFQQAINYYLVAIAALADRNIESDVLTQLRLRVEAEWSGGERRRGRVNGFGQSIAPLLGQPAHAAPEDVFPALLVGGPELAPARHLAGLLLLERCKGDAGIQQGGRGYWPRFCEPDTKPSYDFSPSALVGAAGKEQLAALIHTDGPSETELRSLAERLDLSWTVKVEPGKYFEGEDARGRLTAAVDHFSKQLESGPQARLDQWAAAHDGVAQLSRWREQIAAFPADGLRVPRNRKAAPGLTFSTLLFKFVSSPATAALLALHIKAPKKNGSPAQAETRPALVNFAQLGDDPIKLARGTVGHVFRAFTSLRSWNPADSAKPQWSEFDIAAFKEALKTVNQFRLKTEERAARRSEIQALVDYQWARTDRAPASGDDDDDTPVRLGDDPRFIRLLTALEGLARVDPGREGGYGLRRGGLRGWTELRDEWLRLQRSGANGDSGLYLQAVNEWQACHREGAGDPNLFRELAKPENHLIWQPISTSEAEKHERAADVLRAACMLFEAEDELEQLEVPVRLTPADPVTSPRQFMFSDIKGRHAAKPGPKPGTWDVSIAAGREASASIEATRIRLHVSAPRLRRDQLDAAAEGLLGQWLPPILEGALPERAKELAPELAKPPALELMPDAVAGSPSPRIRRFLVNLPVTLNVDRLASIGRSTFWQKQFNRVEDWPTHLLWPKMKGEPKESPWWSEPAGISILAIDLGQRAAAAAAVIEMRSDGGFSANRAPLPYPLGRTGDAEWRAAVISARLLRLPGEDRVLSQHERRPGQDLEEERSGQSGRLARAHEWDAALELARAFGETDPQTRFGGKPDHASYPEHNDELLRLARAQANRLRRLQSYTWRLLDSDQAEATLTEIREDKMLSDLIPEDATPAAAADMLAARFVQSRADYARNLEHLANRVAPLRTGAWRWAPQGQWHRLELWRLPEQSLDPLAEKTWLAGQRGLSMVRIEQLEDLRRRFLSLNRLQAEEPKSKPVRPRRADPVPPEPCAELLEKIDRLKEQRINQTAQLILAEALGVRLRPHMLTPQERRERDIHGEYERIPGRRPIDVIVVEDLSRYRSSQDRARSENRRLMQWAHRAVTDKLRELAEPFGILVARVPAHYSSRFSARTGAVGFRATEVHAKDLCRFEWRQVKLRVDAKQLRADDEFALRLMQAVEYVGEKSRSRSDMPCTLLCPRDGGAMFVPLTGPGGPMQADVNAAINIGLRAMSAPDCTVARPRWRLEFISNKSSPPTLAALPAAQRNKLETAFWSRAALRWIDDVAGLAKDGRKRTLLFTDPHRVASFDRGEITLDETALPAATSRGLFRAVKERRWARVFELNRQRLSKAGLLDETLSELLKEPGGSAQE